MTMGHYFDICFDLYVHGEFVTDVTLFFIKSSKIIEIHLILLSENVDVSVSLCVYS